MALAHTHLRRLLTAMPETNPRYHWQHLLALLQEVCKERSAESEAVLREIAGFEQKLQLDEQNGLPHSMSPEDFMRSIAVQKLGEWDRVRHRDVITRAISLADHENVVTHARRALV